MTLEEKIAIIIFEETGKSGWTIHSIAKKLSTLFKGK